VPEALRTAFATHGIKVTPAEIAEWRGASKREVVRHFAQLRTSGDPNKLAGLIYADFSAQINRAYKTAQPIAGAEDALHKMRGSGLILAATTGFDRAHHLRAGTPETQDLAYHAVDAGGRPGRPFWRLDSTRTPGLNTRDWSVACFYARLQAVVIVVCWSRQQMISL
jgi:beta-phosphoglucomutase-like phosphatase (HAD superfamily)